MRVITSLRQWSNTASPWQYVLAVLLGIVFGGLASYTGWAGVALAAGVAVLILLLITGTGKHWIPAAIAFSLGIEKVSILGSATVVQVVSLCAALFVIWRFVQSYRVSGFGWNVRGLEYSLLVPVLYGTFFLASGLWGFDSDHFLVASNELAKALLVYCTVLFGSSDDSDIHNMQLGLLLGCVASIVLAVPSIIDIQNVDFRLVGGIGQPNYFASHISLGVLGGVAWGPTLTTKSRRWFVYLLSSVGVAAVILTASRGAMVGLLLGLALLLVIHRNRFAAFLLALVASGVLLLASPSSQILPRQITTRFVLADITQTGGAGRLEIWRDYLSLFLDHPFLGVGAGDAQYRLGLPYEVSEHNTYLGILVEGGVVGAVLFSAVLASPLVRVLANKADHSRHVLLRVIPIQLVSFLVMSFFGGYQMRKVLWVLLAATHLLANVKSEEVDRL